MRPSVIWVAAAVLMGSALHLGCSDSTEPGRPESFSIEIEVRTSTGQPVPGLEVALVNELSERLYQDWPFKGARRAVTAIGFRLPEAARCSLRVYDLDRTLRRTVVGSELPAGEHRIRYVPEDVIGGCNVIRYELVVRDLETGDLLHVDSKLMTVLRWPDVDQSVVGTTDESGRFVITDTRVAPSLFAPGPMVHTDETGQPLGEFSVTDTLTVLVRDPRTQERVVRRHPLGFQRNEIQMTWDPSPAILGKTADVRAPIAHLRQSATISDVPPVPAEFRLEQNYPNPFN